MRFDHYNGSVNYRLLFKRFGYWRKKYLREQVQLKAKGKMIPVHVQVPKQSASPEPSASIEIVYPNGVRVICPAQVEASRVKELIF